MMNLAEMRESEARNAEANLRALKQTTLTEMLINSDTFFRKDQLAIAKKIFQMWLRGVKLPRTYPTVEELRQHIKLAHKEVKVVKPK